MTLYCSFCGKSQNDVRKLIAGPDVHICNECADLCHRIAHEIPGIELPSSHAPRPGSYGCHEALHLTHVFAEIIEEYLAQHPAIRRNSDWAAAADNATATLHNLYQAIGVEHNEAEPEQKVVKFGLRQSPEENGDVT